tara:strand:- start:112 stop:444 length:333 start_codon:yes stop_codon:yes gene_type:complete
MISKFLSKLKSILFKSKTTSEISLPKKTVSKPKKKPVNSSKSSKSKTKKVDSKKIIDSFTAIPGVGAKSAEAFYKAGFKTPKSITSAKDEDLLAVPGVGINLVKKLKKIK